MHLHNLNETKRNQTCTFFFDVIWVTGIATGVSWVIWYFMQRKKKSYAWKMFLFQVLIAISLLLEVNDFPPLFWVLDAHALWHLSTVLPTILLYR